MVKESHFKKIRHEPQFDRAPHICMLLRSVELFTAEQEMSVENGVFYHQSAVFYINYA